MWKYKDYVNWIETGGCVNTSVTCLDLSHNNLNEINQLIGNLTALTKLDLSFNNLTTLPIELGNCKKLKYLNLLDNNLVWLPMSVVELHICCVSCDTDNKTNYKDMCFCGPICYCSTDNIYKK
jgi:Leucine-rich repeat (LRR) protein